jgi:hypothetical protein
MDAIRVMNAKLVDLDRVMLKCTDSATLWLHGDRTTGTVEARTASHFTGSRWQILDAPMNYVTLNNLGNSGNKGFLQGDFKTGQVRLVDSELAGKTHWKVHYNPRYHNSIIKLQLGISEQDRNNFRHPKTWLQCTDQAVQLVESDHAPGTAWEIPPFPPQVSFALNNKLELNYTPSVIDLDHDGWVDVLGYRNDKKGNLEIDPSIPLKGVSYYAKESSANLPIRRDNRVFDFNGDGRPDIIFNTYSGSDTFRATLYIQRQNQATGKWEFKEEKDFAKDEQGHPLALYGRGETIVVADFNNDGHLDIFLPYYTYQPPEGPYQFNSSKCYLLINDGTGHFVDRASAQVALVNIPHTQRPEGAQAVDFNNDGWIDLYVAGHLFINNGDLTFTDKTADYGLPTNPYQFDEGARFLDWNNDGHLDLIVSDSNVGSPRLFEFDGNKFHERQYTIGGVPLFSSGPPDYKDRAYSWSFGLNTYDINNDGREDLLIMGSAPEGGKPFHSDIFINTGEGFELAGVSGGTDSYPWTPMANEYKDDLANGNAGMALGDIDRDGKIDVVYPAYHRKGHPEVDIDKGTPALYHFKNLTQTTYGSFSVEMLGENGERNQQGRIIKASPRGRPDIIYTRVVDGGSGLMTQNQYPILFGTPFSGWHDIQVFYSPKTGQTSMNIVRFSIRPGQQATVRPDGVHEIKSYQPPQYVQITVEVTNINEHIFGTQAELSVVRTYPRVMIGNSGLYIQASDPQMSKFTAVVPLEDEITVTIEIYRELIHKIVNGKIVKTGNDLYVVFGDDKFLLPENFDSLSDQQKKHFTSYAQPGPPNIMYGIVRSLSLFYSHVDHTVSGDVAGDENKFVHVANGVPNTVDFDFKLVGS